MKKKKKFKIAFVFDIKVKRELFTRYKVCSVYGLGIVSIESD